MALTHQDVWRCAFCGFTDGAKYLANPGLRQREQLEAEQRRIEFERQQAEQRQEREARLAALPKESNSEKVSYYWNAYPAQIVIGSVIVLAVLGLPVVLLMTNQPTPVTNQVPMINPAPTVKTPTSFTARTPEVSVPTPVPYVTMTPKKTPTPVVALTATVISENANLRVAPDSNGDVIDVIPLGETIEVIKQRGPWFEVRYSGTSGWIHGNTIRLDTGY